MEFHLNIAICTTSTDSKMISAEDSVIMSPPNAAALRILRNRFHQMDLTLWPSGGMLEQ